MRPKENYSRYVVAGLVLTLAMLVSFQIYILREPQRIAAVSNEDKAIAVAAGQALFKNNCALCHGDNGEGDSGPALNDKTFLKTTADDTIFSVISSGIPGTEMPAWNQAAWRPVDRSRMSTKLVAYLRSWQDHRRPIRRMRHPRAMPIAARIFAMCAPCAMATRAWVPIKPRR